MLRARGYTRGRVSLELLPFGADGASDARTPSHRAYPPITRAPPAARALAPLVAAPAIA